MSIVLSIYLAIPLVAVGAFLVILLLSWFGCWFDALLGAFWALMHGHFLDLDTYQGTFMPLGVYEEIMAVRGWMAVMKNLGRLAAVTIFLALVALVSNGLFIWFLHRK
jgi:hypothetical protein